MNPDEGAVRKSISLPADMWAELHERMRPLGYRKVSHYLQYLVRQDLLRKGSHVIREDASSEQGHSSVQRVVDDISPRRKRLKR